MLPALCSKVGSDEMAGEGITELSPEYLKMCEGAFCLACKGVPGFSTLQAISMIKKKLEIDRGCYVGAGSTRSRLPGFAEGAI